MARRKVICVGVNKTGTTSLGEALKFLGYRNLDFVDQNYVLFRDNERANLLEISRNYDSFTDSPWHLIYEDLDRAYPDAKFVLTIRKDKNWFNSIVRYYDDRIKYSKVGVLLNLIFGEPIIPDFDNTPTKQNASLFLYLYRRRNAEIIKYFSSKPGKLLVVDWENGDGWYQICNFLGHEVPEEPFPHKMKSVSKFAFYVDYYVRRIFNLFK